MMFGFFDAGRQDLKRGVFSVKNGMNQKALCIAFGLMCHCASAEVAEFRPPYIAADLERDCTVLLWVMSITATVSHGRVGDAGNTVKRRVNGSQGKRADVTV